MKSENKTVLIVFFVIILGLAVFLLFQAQSKQDINTEHSNGQEEPSDNQKISSDASGTIPAEEGYPDQVLDGNVTEVNLEGENPTIKMNARIFKIVMDAGEEVKTIKIPFDVEVISYNMNTEEQKTLSLEEIEVGDSVSVAVEESTFEDISREIFTAFRITKLLAAPQAE